MEGSFAEFSSHVERPGAIIDWNEAFQKALELPDGQEKFALLAKITVDFVGTSKKFGMVIIDEMRMPEKDKTIRTQVRSPPPVVSPMCVFHWLEQKRQ